jgi:hypothetical protein
MFKDAPTSYKDPFWRGLAATVESEIGIPSGLLQNVLLKGERSNADQVSSAGARTPFQIIPQTREAVQKKYGVDAYSSPENAAKAAALLLKESLDRNNGSTMRAVQEYHGGTDPKNYGPINAAYVKRVVGDMEPEQDSQVNELVRMYRERMGGKQKTQPEQPNYGMRADNTPKGRGFLGEIKTQDGRVMTENSIGVDFGRGEMEIPTIVPTLTQDEIQYLSSGGEPTDAIVDKAVAHAKQRVDKGLSPFAQSDETPEQADSGVDELVRAYKERMAAKPRPPLGREEAIAQIPTQTGAPVPAPTPTQKPGIRDVAEAGLSMVSGSTTGMLGGALGVIDALPNAIFGKGDFAETITQGAKAGFDAGTYDPSREAGRQLVRETGEFITQDLKVPPVLPIIGPTGALAPTLAAQRPIQQAAQAAKAVQGAAKAAPDVLRKLPARVQERLASMDRFSQRQGAAGAQGVEMETLRREAANELPVPMGQSLTKGQASRDFEQTRFERETAKDAERGKPLRDNYADQNKKLLMNMDSFIDQTGAETTSKIQTGKVITKALMDRAQADKVKINELYKRAEQSPEAMQPIKIDSVFEYINNNRAEAAVSPALKFAKAKAIELGMATETPDGRLIGRPITLIEGERLRKAIGAATGNDAPDIRQASILKGLYDADTENAGGALYKTARRARENYAKRFENRAVIADLLETKRNSDDRRVALEDVQSRIIDKGSREDLSILMGILDSSGEEGRQAVKELRGATLMKIKANATKSANRDEMGNPIVSADKLNSSIRQLDEDGKLERLYGKKGAEQLRTLADVAKVVLTVPAGSVNYSNTASVLAGLTDVALTGLAQGVPMPIATTARLLAKKVKDKRIQAKINDALGKKPSKENQ